MSQARSWDALTLGDGRPGAGLFFWPLCDFPLGVPLRVQEGGTPCTGRRSPVYRKEVPRVQEGGLGYKMLGYELE